MKQLFTLLLFLLTASQVWATNYYWRGGTGNFNDTSKWEINAIGSGITPLNAPLSTDNVYFPASAFTSAGDTVYVDGPSNCLNMRWDNAISAANAPVFIDVTTTPAGNTTLDIYGSLNLATNMEFAFRGMLRFRSTSGIIQNIQTRGHQLLLRRIEFDGASTTEWRLVDDLYIDDIDQRSNNWGWFWNSPTRQGQIVLKRGTFNTNGQNMRVDFFYSVFGNADRGLNIANSYISVHGYTAGGARPWQIDFDATAGNFSLFNATGSHLFFQQTGNNWQRVVVGNGLTYDSLSADNTIYFQGGATPCFFSYMDVPYTTTFYLNLDVTDMHWTAGGNYRFVNANGRGELTVENIHLPTVCDKFTLVEGLNQYRGLIRKRTAGATLTLNNCILEDMDCDPSGGRSYIANSSIDGGGNQADWVINPPTGKDMYFRDYSGDQNWHDPNNWEIWNGVSFQPNLSGCIPSPADNVFFDGASFPNPNKWVQVDSAAYCNDMRWLSSIPVGAAWQLNSSMRIYGTMQLHSNMQDMTGNSTISFYGNDPDSIITDGVTISRAFLQKFAIYHLIGNTTCNSNFTGFIQSTVFADNLDLTCQNIDLANRHLDSVQVYIQDQQFRDAGGTADYTGTTTFHFQGTGSIVRANRFYPYNNIVRIPNTIVYNTKFLLEGTSSQVHGDLYLYDDMEVRSPSNVSGSMALYEGKVTLSAGKTYSIERISIADSLIAKGNCNQQITIEPYDVAVGRVSVADATKAILDYCFVRDMNNTGPTITSLTSIDGGNNTNFVFNTGAGTVYYWRAEAGNPTNFVGNWSNPNHWTTNQSDLTGTLGGCIPSLADSVIFDNLSFSGTSNGCTIDKTAFCKTLICRDDISLSGNNPLYVGESFHLHNNMSNYSYQGTLYFIGSGSNNIVDPNNTTMPNHTVRFQNASGTWNLVNDLHLSAASNNRHRGLFFAGGTFNSNSHDITINGISLTASEGVVNLGTSTINMMSNNRYSSYYGYLWNISDTAAVKFNADATTINFFDNTSGFSYNKDLFMGNGQVYNYVNFYENDEFTILRNNATFNYAYFEGSARIVGNNYFDSLRLAGSHYYYISNGRTQTLAPGHGKILANGSPGNFVHIETSPSGGTSYFHKEYGSAFCLDFVKVKDNEATKGTTPPPAWATQHPFLQFETGVNSDNINGTATGIWAFNLPPILNITSNHPDSTEHCQIGDTAYIPLTLTGTYPYSIIYSWTDILGNSGIDTVIVTDDDADVMTPFQYDLAVVPNATTTYTLNIAALRCGGRYYHAPISTAKVKLPEANPLVSVDREGSCYLTNSSSWAHFVDDTEGKPILSILDSTNTSDTDSLLTVNVGVDFDASVQFWNGKPYLQRTWKVDPTNNAAATVRLYFTQEELDSLGVYTFDGLAPIPSTELILWKFPDTATVGTPTLVPFTVIPLVGAAAAPFSNTTDLYAIEFEVTSFSGFMLQPTDDALLSMESLLNFEADYTAQKTVNLTWELEQTHRAKQFVVERSSNGINFESIGTVQAFANKAHYGLTDQKPLSDYSYYRLRLINQDGTINYSPTRTIYIETLDQVEVYPNPNDGQFNISVERHKKTSLSVQLVNSLGQVVYQEVLDLEVGMNTYQIQPKTLSSGVYRLQLTDNEGHSYHKNMLIRK